MFSYLRLLNLVLIAVFLVGCAPDKNYSIKIEGIKSISQHEVTYYSVIVADQKGGFESISLERCKATFLIDIPPEKDMWVEETYVLSSAHGLQNSHCVFHIHSLKEINGGGWNHGKFALMLTLFRIYHP